MWNDKTMAKITAVFRTGLCIPDVVLKINSIYKILTKNTDSISKFGKKEIFILESKTTSENRRLNIIKYLSPFVV